MHGSKPDFGLSRAPVMLGLDLEVTLNLNEALSHKSHGLAVAADDLRTGPE
jgi:hypothetical protein